MPVEAITSFSQFESLTNGDKPVVIDYWASWCRPCLAISPTFEQLSNSSKYAGLAFYKVNIDDQPDIAQSNKFTIKSIPAFAVFSKGEVVQEKAEQVVGADKKELKMVGANKEGLTNLLNGAIKSLSSGGQ